MAQTNDNNTHNGKAAHKAALVWRQNQRNVEPRLWSDIDSDAIRAAIDAVTRSGGAIMFGVTSDGGAYSLCILQGNDKIKEYPSSPEAALETLESLTDWYVNFKL